MVTHLATNIYSYNCLLILLLSI